MWHRLWNLLDDPGDDDWAYVYAVDQLEKPIKPYLAKYWLPGIDLIWELQSKLGGNRFCRESGNQKEILAWRFQLWLECLRPRNHMGNVG